MPTHSIPAGQVHGPYSDDLKVRVDQMFSTVLRAVWIVIAVGIALTLLGESTPAQFTVAALALPYALAILLLQRRGYAALCVHAMVFGLIAFSVALSAASGSVRGSGTLAMVLGITLGGVFLERRALAAAAAIAVCSSAALIYAEHEGWLPSTPSRLTADYGLIYGFVLVTLALIVFHTRSLLQDILVRLTEELEVRRKAEAAARQSENRFRKVFESSPVGMTITRLSDGRYIELNPSDVETLGYTREEMIGRTTVEMGAWPAAGDRERFLAAFRAGPGVRGYATQMRNKAGDLVDCRIWADLIELDGEECVLSTTLNVTEQQRTERLLRQSEAKYSAIFATTPDAIAISRESDSVQLDVNEAWVRITGYPRAQAVGHSANELGLWQDRAQRVQALALLAGKRELVNFPARFTIADGRTIDVLLSGVREVLGGDACVVWSWRDVTELRVAEQKTLRALERFQRVFDNSPDSITISRLRDGEVIAVNDAWVRLSGYSREQAVGRKAGGVDQWMPGDREAVMAQVRADGRVINRLTSFLRPDGSIRQSLISVTLIDVDGEPCTLFIGRDVTQQQRIEERERQVQAKYQALFETSPEGIAVTRLRDGAIIEANDAAFAQLALPREDAIGKTVLALNVGAVPGERDRIIARLKTDGRIVNHETAFRRFDGVWLQLLLSAVTMKLNGERCVLWSWRDITERRKQEKLLERIARGVNPQTGAEFFRTLVQSLCDELPADMAFVGEIVGTGDRIRTIACCSDGVLGDNFEYALAGSPCSQALEKRGTVIYSQGVAQLFPQDKGLALRGMSGYVGTSLFDSGGKPIGILVAMTRKPVERAEFFVSLLEIFAARAAAEIQRVHAEDHLVASEARFRAIFERSKAGIATWGLDGRFLTANSAFCEFVGYSAEELVGSMSAGDLRQPDEDEGLDLTGRMLLGEIPHVTRDRRYKRRDASTVWGRTTVAGVRGKDGALQYFITAVIDITEAQEARERIEMMNAELENRIRRRTEELEAANRELTVANHDLDSFGYSVAHDLRTPLSSITGYSDLLRETEAGRLSDDGVQMLAEIDSNASRMTCMLAGLFEFSRLGRKPVTMESVPMATLVHEIIADMRDTRSATRLEFRIEPMPDALGDPVLLRHVWQNLIGNAVKYSRARNPAIVEIGYDGSKSAYFVRDNGAGFDMRLADKLFAVFERLHGDTEFEGSGVGLAIVHRIVQKHGGEVGAEGEPGLGATFRFSLPSA